MLKKFRQNAWVFQPSEILAAALLGLFFVFGLGAAFSRQAGAASTLSYASLDLVLWGGWLAYLLFRQPPPFGRLGFLRGIAPWLVLLLSGDLTARLVFVVHPLRYDLSMRSVDPAVWGGGASGWGRFLFENRGAVGFVSFLYLSLFVWLAVVACYHLFFRRALYQRFLLGVLIVVAGGCLGTLLFPAAGPRDAFPQAWEWLSGGLLLGWAERFSSLFPPSGEGFPSMHGAIAAYLVLWQWRQDRNGLVWGLPLMVGVWASTLFLGEQDLPSLVSGLLLASAASWVAPRLEREADELRRRLDPPVTWLTELTEGRGDFFGRLTGRFSDILPLGGAVSPGVVFGRVHRNRGEEPLRRALAHMGEGPFWLRPSDGAGSGKSALTAMKPLSREQAIRTAFLQNGRKCFLFQKALKVSAVGLCRSHPTREGRKSEVELRVTTLPRGDTRELHLWPGKILGGRIEGPWVYYPAGFPVKGFDLFELVQLARGLADKWRSSTEVEWILSEGRVYVLDGRTVRQAAG